MPKRESTINYAYQKSVSYSQYSMYKQCNFRWYLNYVKKQRVFKPSIHTLFGTSFHETIQEYLRLMYEESVKKSEEFDYENFLKERMIANYKEEMEKNKDEHYVKKEDFNAFIQDGVNIMSWVKKNRKKYFTTRKVKLIGIEIPMEQYIVEDIPNVIMQGYIDIIFYDEDLKKYTVIDFKTSTSGWKDADKKDDTKLSQLLLYKHFYSRALKISPEDVDVMFMIVKRRPFISEDFPTHWVQEIKPAQGKAKLKKAVEDFEAFVRDCFTPEAKFVDKEYPKNFDACKWCEFKDKPEICSKS